MQIKEFGKYLLLSFAFYFILALVLFIYLSQKGSLVLLSEQNLLQFDAELYSKIKTEGYSDFWLCAFFPAFPYLWKILSVSTIGISIVNSIIFIVSSSALAYTYKLNWKRQLFFLSIPSLIFMFVPYTESLFFACGTILLIGLKNNKTHFVLLGLLLGSLVRPTTFVFIPAILGAYFFAENDLKKTITKSLLPILTLVIGLFITISVHYSFTKKWFVFFEAQKMWKNFLHFPHLPLTSWGGDACVRYDASALTIALICGGFIFYSIFKKTKMQTSLTKDFSFSILYIFGTTLLILAYRDGNLYSLNRFIYAVPFIMVALNHFFDHYTFKWKHLFLVFIGTELIWLLFNSYNHIHNLLMFSTVSLYFLLMFLYKHPHKTISAISLIVLISINCIGIIKLAYRYLNGAWIA